MINKNLSKPSASVIERAIEFLDTFGKDDKKLKALLLEMKDVQKHNEQVLLESQSSLKFVNGETVALLKKQIEFKNEETARFAIRNKQIENWNRKTERIEAEHKVAEKAFSNRQRTVAEREIAIASREVDVKRRTEACTHQEARNVLETDRLVKSKSEFNKKLENLSLIMAQLDNLQ